MSSDFHSKYTIQNQIGEGTFSDVMRCKDVNSGKLVAVKVLKKKYKSKTDAKNLAEMILLEKLPPHPNVLPLLEYIFEPREGKLYMVFELMEMSLYESIQSRKRCLPESKVKHLFYQILKGVEHLHANGVFHRDIKPENILIKKNSVKLADMGSVRGITSEPPYTEYISTRWYRAPECILTSGVYGPKMDVWACGCVYFELLTSKPLFPGSNEIDQLNKIHQVTGTPNIRVISKMRRNKSRVGDVKFATYPAMNLTIILPFTSDGGREILKRMLAYDPDVRTNVRRILEHRYFNDLRESELIAKQVESSQSTKHWTSTLISDPTKLKKKVSNIRTKDFNRTETGKKLTTNTWAPSTNTKKIILSSSKSKPNNKITSDTVKKKPGQLYTNSKPQQKYSPPFKRQSKLSEEDLPIKFKKSSVGTITSSVSSKQTNMWVQNNVSACNLKRINRGFLPPIPEL